MATATTTDPKSIISESKVAGMLDDMFDDGLDTDSDAEALGKGAVYRAMSSTGRRPFDDAWDRMLAAVEASEKERSVVLAGKAKDLRKFKGLVQTQLDAIVSCQEVVGRMQVLEDAAMAAVLAEVVGAYALIAGPGGTVRGLEGQLADIQRKLEAAERVARDEKVKLAVSAAVTAAGVVMPELSLAGKAAMALTNLSIDAALDAALQGREDGQLKSTWDKADKIATVAEGMTSCPRRSARWWTWSAPRSTCRMPSRPRPRPRRCASRWPGSSRISKRRGPRSARPPTSSPRPSAAAAASWRRR